MRCSDYVMPDGSHAIVCGGGPRKRTCSTRGCRRKEAFTCDHPVEREVPDAPVKGDARVHREHQRVFYIHLVHGNATVTISQSPPGSREIRFPQTVDVTDWFAKTSPTCDEPVCVQCAGHLGALDLCAAHKPDAASA